MASMGCLSLSAKPSSEKLGEPENGPHLWDPGGQQDVVQGLYHFIPALHKSSVQGHWLEGKILPFGKLNLIYFPSFPQFCTQTEDILACCGCWKADKLQAALWGFTVCRKVSAGIPAWLSQQGEGERTWVGRLRKKNVLNEKRCELWASGCTTCFGG